MKCKNRRLQRLAALMMAAAMIFAYSVVPVNQSYAASKKPTKMTITASSKTIDIKGKTTVSVKSVTPKSASKAVTYKSSNKKIATVSSKGVVTGKKKGSVKITVTSKANKKLKKTITIKVKQIAPTIKLNKTKASIYESNTLKLKASMPAGVYNAGVTWTTSDASIATVKSGTVTALKPGTVTIKAASKEDKKVTASCKVTVKQAIEIIEDDHVVRVKGKINSKYFTTSTRHLMIDNNGFNKGKPIITSYATPEFLYNALTQVGGVSWSKSADKMLDNGEKITKGNAENKNFSHLKVSIITDSGYVDLQDALTTVKDSTNPKDAPKIDMVFSGNPAAAAKTPSGCVACLDSCYIGIVSNDEYGLCVIDNEQPPVYARADKLPASGDVWVEFALIAE